MMDSKLDRILNDSRILLFYILSILLIGLNGE